MSFENFLSIGYRFPALPWDNDSEKGKAIFFPVFDNNGNVIKWSWWPTSDQGIPMVQVTGMSFSGNVEVGNVGLYDTTGTQIDPATNETLEEILAALGGLEAPVQTTITRDANGFVSSIAQFDGTHTLTDTIHRNADNTVASISETLT